MNYFDALRLAVGSVVVARSTVPPFAPLKIYGIFYDDHKKRALVSTRPDNWIGPNRTVDAIDLERAPELARWDPDKRAWFSLGSGAQVLPRGEEPKPGESVDDVLKADDRYFRPGP